MAGISTAAKNALNTGWSVFRKFGLGTILSNQLPPLSFPAAEANKIPKYDAAGTAMENVAYGTTSNTVAQGNDSRFAPLAFPAAEANKFPKYSSDAKSLELVAYGSTSNTVTQGNDSRLPPLAFPAADANKFPKYASDAKSIEVVAFGSSNNTVCQGNDARIPPLSFPVASANKFPKYDGAGTAMENVAYGATTNTVAQGDDGRFPSSDEKGALAGTSGTPSASNKFVTNADTRNTDARTPASHDNTYHSKTFIEAAGVTYEALNANGDIGAVAATVAAGDDARFPTTDENAALAGTSGTPSASNKYSTADDIAVARAENTDVVCPCSIGDFAGVAGTWTKSADDTNDRLQLTRTANAADESVFIALNTPSLRSTALKGRKITGVRLAWNASGELATDVDALLYQALLPANGATAHAASTSLSASQTYDTGHDSAAERKAAGNHCMQITLATPAYLAGGQLYLRFAVSDGGGAGTSTVVLTGIELIASETLVD